MSHCLSTISMNCVTAHLNQSTASPTPCSCRGLVQWLSFGRCLTSPYGLSLWRHSRTLGPARGARCAVADDTSRSPGLSDRRWLTCARARRRQDTRSHRNLLALRTRQAPLLKVAAALTSWPSDFLDGPPQGLSWAATIGQRCVTSRPRHGHFNDWESERTLVASCTNIASICSRRSNARFRPA
jgi:hypothetical protein